MQILSLTVIFILPIFTIAQHTFSIVAVDSVTNEIGSAGATCIGSEDGALVISDIILGKGAIHTQADWTPVNQKAARIRMLEGDSPEEIVEWLINNDNSSQGGDINTRQYGVVDLHNGSPRSFAFTGNSAADAKGHRTGPGYSIQGNILISEDVLDDMELAYVNTIGSLAEKLMAVLQAAKRPGADSRCLSDGISSASAFIRVAKPTDQSSEYGYLWLDINVWLNDGAFTGDPIDELQKQFSEFISLSNTPEVIVYPNPTSGLLTVKIETQNCYLVRISNTLGQIVRQEEFCSNQFKMNLSELMGGVYFLETFDEFNKRTTIERIVFSKP